MNLKYHDYHKWKIKSWPTCAFKFYFVISMALQVSIFLSISLSLSHFSFMVCNSPNQTPNLLYFSFSDPSLNSTLNLDSKSLLNIWATIIILVENVPFHRDCTASFPYALLFNNFFRWSSIAFSQYEVSTSSQWITKACKLDGYDLLVVWTLKVSCRFDHVYNRSDLAFLPCPWLNMCWIILCYVTADCVSVYSQNLYVFGICFLFFQHNNQILWLL